LKLLLLSEYSCILKPKPERERERERERDAQTETDRQRQTDRQRDNNFARSPSHLLQLLQKPPPLLAEPVHPPATLCHGNLEGGDLEVHRLLQALEASTALIQLGPRLRQRNHHPARAADAAAAAAITAAGATAVP